MYRDTTNVEPEMYVVPVIIGATGIVTRSLKKNFETIPGKRLDRFTTKDSYTWNITHNTESTAM